MLPIHLHLMTFYIFENDSKLSRIFIVFYDALKNFMIFLKSKGPL